MSNIPAELKYAKSHEWVKIEGKTARVGISDHAQHELTDIVFVELPQTGKVISAGQVACVVESVKVAADIYSPVSGKISKVNSNLESNPGLINSDPYNEGWIFEMEITESNASLLDSQAYGSLVGA